MKIGHKEKTDANRDNAAEFDFVVRVNTASEVVCDLLVEEDDGATRCHNQEADNKPANAKCPNHTFYFSISLHFEGLSSRMVFIGDIAQLVRARH